MLERKDLQYFKEKLLNEKTKIENLLQESGIDIGDGDWVGATPEGGKTESDPTYAADHVEEMSSNIERTNVLEQELDRVRKALVRVEEGTYGVSVVSGDPIKRGRLEVNPSADRNVSEIVEKLRR